MPRAHSLLAQHETFIAAAAIAAHANAAGGAFRQRDLRFLFELFINWVEQSLSGGLPVVSNPQISRFLEELVTEGFARKHSKQHYPTYRLTRLGLLHLLTRLASRSERYAPEQLFFVHYFLSNYGPRIAELIGKEGRDYPPALKLELHALLDAKRLLQIEIGHLQRALTSLRQMQHDSLSSARLARSLFREGRDVATASAQLEAQYPYALNSQKPLTDLLGSIPPDLAKWEIEVGYDKRAEELWEPVMELTKRYLEILTKLANRGS